MNFRTAHEIALGADGGKRAAFITSAVAIAAFYETHPGAAVPECTTLSFTVPPGSDEMAALAFVDQRAAELGVHAAWRDGTYGAARSFGAFVVEVHHTPRDVRDRAVLDALGLPARKSVPAVAA